MRIGNGGGKFIFNLAQSTLFIAAEKGGGAHATRLPAYNLNITRQGKGE